MYLTWNQQKDLADKLLKLTDKVVLGKVNTENIDTILVIVTTGEPDGVNLNIYTYYEEDGPNEIDSEYISILRKHPTYLGESLVYFEPGLEDFPRANFFLSIIDLYKELVNGLLVEP